MKCKFALVLFTAMMLVLSVTLGSTYVEADSHNVYCYDEDQEGYICFDTCKMCENEQKNDLTAESKCYKMKS